MSTGKYKNQIINLKGYKCELCNIYEWKNNPICLELDHIDGNNKNNNLENLRILCPNCHSQTETFRGRNINAGKKVSDDDLLKALDVSENIRQALIKVGLTPKGGNYKRAAKILNLSYDKPIDTKNSQYNTCWINNSIINKKIKKDILNEYISNGWTKGRLLVSPPSIKGRYWVTNGITNKLVLETPEGFWKGKFQP